MNQTGCPAGLATDEILMNGFEPGRCDMSVVVWNVLAAIAILGRFVIFVLHSHLWWTREARNWQTNTGKRYYSAFTRRLPVVPILSFFYFLVLAIFLPLASANVINTSNGFGSFWVGIVWFLFTTQSLLYLKKFVSLGVKLVRGAKNLFASSDATSMNLSNLAKFDMWGRVSLIMCIVSAWAAIILFSVVNPILPQRYIVIQIASAFQAWFIVQIVISVHIQIRRITVAIERSVASILPETNPRGRLDLHRVKVKLLEQSLSVWVFGLLSCSFYILVAAQVILARYFVYLIVIYSDLTNNLIFAITTYKSYRSAGRDGKSKTSINTTSADNNNKATRDASKPESSSFAMTSHQQPMQVRQGRRVSWTEDMSYNNTATGNNVSVVDVDASNIDDQIK